MAGFRVHRYCSDIFHCTWLALLCKIGAERWLVLRAFCFVLRVPCDKCGFFETCALQGS